MDTKEKRSVLSFFPLARTSFMFKRSVSIARQSRTMIMMEENTRATDESKKAKI